MKPLNPNFWTRVAGRLQYRNLGWEESQVRHSVFPAYFNGEVDEPVLIYYEVYDCHSSGYVNDSLYQREECYIRPGDVVLDLGANIGIFREQDRQLTNIYEDLSGAVRVYIKIKPLIGIEQKNNPTTIRLKNKVEN